MSLLATPPCTRLKCSSMYILVLYGTNLFSRFSIFTFKMFRKHVLLLVPLLLLSNGFCYYFGYGRHFHFLLLGLISSQEVSSTVFVRLKMSKKLSNKSKRTTTRQRVKQQKKLKEHQKKMRKEKKVNPGKFKKSRKDPGVPAECPFKDEVLKECADARARKEELKEKKREEMKRVRI